MTANHRLLDNNDIMLIERVKQTNALYDPRHPEFRTYRKEQIWAQLATSLNMTPSDSKRRWTCLRDRYSRELKQMRKHPENEDYGKNEFFRQMDFLRKFVKVRRDRRSTASVVDYKSECSTASEKYEKVNNKVSEEYEEDGENTITEEEVTNSYDGTINKNRFEMKSAISNACTSYPEFVEEVGYEEYVDATQVNSETNKDNSNNKAHNASMPVLLDTTDNAFTAKAHAKCGTSPQQIVETIPHQTEFMQQKNEQPQQQPQQQQQTTVTETEDDFFSKSVAAYLRQLTRRNKIKAKVEMFQILEKYIELEEESRSSAQTNTF